MQLNVKIQYYSKIIFYLRTFHFYTKETHIKNKSNKIALTFQNKIHYIGKELFNAGYKIM